jgi:hypothetical protein
MGAKGHKVQEVTRDFEVGVKFPDRPVAQQGGGDGPGEDPLVPNGDASSEGSTDNDAPRKCDIIIITGKKENCEAAKNALLVSLLITDAALENVSSYECRAVINWSFMKDMFYFSFLAKIRIEV